MTMNHSAKVNFFFIQNVIYSKVQLKCFRHKSKSGWRHLSLKCGKKENLGKKRIIFHFVEGSARTYNSERRISFPWLKAWRLFRDSRRDVFLIYFSFSAQLTFFSPVFSFLFFSFNFFSLFFFIPLLVKWVSPYSLIRVAWLFSISMSVVLSVLSPF